MYILIYLAPFNLGPLFNEEGLTGMCDNYSQGKVSSRCVPLSSSSSLDPRASFRSWCNARNAEKEIDCE